MLASGVAAAAINSLTGGAGGAVLGRTVDLWYCGAREDAGDVLFGLTDTLKKSEELISGWTGRWHRGCGLDVSLTADWWSILNLVQNCYSQPERFFRTTIGRRKCDTIDYIPVRFCLTSLGEVISWSVDNTDVKAASVLFFGDDFRRMMEAQAPIVSSRWLMTSWSAEVD